MSRQGKKFIIPREGRKAIAAMWQHHIEKLGIKEIEELLVLNFIMAPALTEDKIELEKPDKPHMLFQIILGFISSLATQDPSTIHFAIVRKTIEKIDATLLDEDSTIDMMARKLAAQCKNLKLKLIKHAPIQKLIKDTISDDGYTRLINKPSNFKPLSLTAFELSIPSNLEATFELDEMFFWDKILLDTLKNTGKYGNTSSNDYKEKFRERLTLFKAEGKNPLTFWFNSNIDSARPEEPFYISPALQILSKCIFEDLVKPRISFAKKNVTALTKKTLDPIKKILSPAMEVIETSDKIQITHKDLVVCNVNIPTISQKMSSIILCGANKLNTVTGHRVLRLLPQEAFNQRINGIDDYRVLRYDRASTEIAEKLGMKSNNAITAINQIVHAMAYLDFATPYFSGNLIQLSKYKSPITKRQEAFEIVVGTPLLPYQTFKDGSLLIPLLSDPPLVNPNQSHAGQYLLQMELMEECSNQSIFIAKEDVVQITQEQWKTLAQSSGLSTDILKKVQDRWTQDGDDGEKFLEKIVDNFYKLGPKYKKEWDFLREQGLIRTKNSNQGKTSALNRINSKNKLQIYKP